MSGDCAVVILAALNIIERKKMDFKTMKPRQVEAYLREKVRQIFGDAVENGANIYSRNGYYSMFIGFDLEGRSATFLNFRKSEVPKIVKAMKALAE